MQKQLFLTLARYKPNSVCGYAQSRKQFTIHSYLIAFATKSFIKRINLDLSLSGNILVPESEKH